MMHPISRAGIVRISPGFLCLMPGALFAQGYTIADGSLGPLDTDIFIAAADGTKAGPLLSHAGLDYSFSATSDWVVFTSERDGAVRTSTARHDGREPTRLTAGLPGSVPAGAML
jgi:hypothetical protein